MGRWGGSTVLVMKWGSQSHEENSTSQNRFRVPHDKPVAHDGIMMGMDGTERLGVRLDVFKTWDVYFEVYSLLYIPSNAQ